MNDRTDVELETLLNIKNGVAIKGREEIYLVNTEIYFWAKFLS